MLIEQLETQPSAGQVLQPVAVARVVDQDPPHRFRGGGGEVPAAVEMLVSDQPQVGLVHEGGGG